MLTIGWVAVLLGVLAMQWADGGFPFLTKRVGTISPESTIAASSVSICERE
jgi:hypothetical protein